MLLVLVLVLSIFPSAVAAGTEDVPQGTLEPTNFPAEYGNLYIQWNRLSNAQYYTVQLYKHQGDGEQYVLLYSETLTASQVTTSPYKLDVTDWIKSYGAGDYMANIVIERKYTTPTKASIEMTVTQLATPTNVSVSTDGKVSWNQVTDNHGYEVTVTVGGQTQTYKVDQDVREVNASEFIQGFAGSVEALTVSASVKAYGNLDNEYRTVDSAFSAPATTLPEKVGVLPTPVIANSNVVSEGSKLYVEYTLEPGSVGKEYIDSLTLTLENTVVKTQTYTTKSVDTTGRIEVTYLNDGTTTLPEGTYNAVITANPKYPDLNAPASSEGTVTYGVDPLDAPVLTVSDDASKLSWPAVELSQGTLDSTADYEVQYKEHSEEDWVTVSITNGNAIQQDGNGFYVDLTTLIDAGTLYDFKVIAKNNEDLTLGNTSSASIQIFKTVVPTEVKIEARNSEDKVFATWTAPAIAEGIDHYQVDVYMDGVLKTSLSTTGVVNELDISGAIDAADENKYTVKVIAIGQHLVNGVFYGDSVVSEESNPVTSGTVAAPEIEFETRAGTSTSYNVYFAGKDATSLPAHVEGYNVTITYVLATSGATNTWTGVVKDFKCDIAQLKNQNGSQFMTTSWGDYANAEFTVKAVALSTNTALHANSDEVTGEDTFELSDIGRELNIQVKTESGRTVVSWNEIPGASYYFYTVQKVGEDNFVGTVQVTEADITDYLTSAGQWSVTVNALAQDGSTVYVNGNKDIRLTVLAAPSVTINTVDDTATANWTAVTGATSYDVVVCLEGTVIKRDNVTSDVLSYSLTDLIKEKGPGTYTVEVTAVGDGSAYITSLEPGTATIEITKLTAPGVTFALNSSGRPTVTITPVSGGTVESYTVYLYADGKLIKTLTNQQAKAINVINYLKDYKTAEKAVTFKAEVEAVGSLHHNTLTSVKQSAELTEKVGRLPMPTITTDEIKQTDGQLRVYYTIADNDVPLSQIEKLVLTLTYTKDNSSTTETYTLNDVSSYAGYFDVSGGNFDGQIDAAIEATVKYAALNTAAKSEADLTYNVIDLPDPQLQVSDDGSRLYWEAIPMSDNKAVDTVGEFTLRVKKDANATWISEGIGEQIKYDDVTEVFYVDLTNLLNNYSVYEITAKNNEDVTYTGSSVAEITIAKLADVTTVRIVSQSGAVKATWVDSANTAGVSGYRVELLKLNDAGSYDVWKTYTAAAGETSYTFADEDIDQSAVDTYKVRVTALGTKDYEADVFYADANPAESTVKLVSGQLPTVAETGTIYEESGKLYLKVALNDTNNNYSKISSVQLTKLQGGIMTYEPARALRAKLMKATDTDPAYAIFDLSSIYQSGSLAGIEWTATINVVSRNEQLNAGGTYTTTAAYGIEALNMGALSVDSKTGAVSWERVPGATGYKVEVSYNLNQTWTANTDNDGDIITYEIKDPLGGDTLVPGRTYTITVYAYSDKTMENPTGTPATAQLCKIVAPTNAALTVTPTAVTATWTKSVTKDGVAYNEVTATCADTVLTGKTANATAQKLNLVNTFKNAADGAYTVAVKTKAMTEAVNDVYYVDSDAVEAGTAYVGEVPADEITGVAITWGEGSTLNLTYTLPTAAADDTDLRKEEIDAIVKNTVEVTLKSGSTVVGTYTDDDGDGKINVTNGTGDNATVPVANYNELSVVIKLASNYKLIAGASATYTASVPKQGVIGFEGFTVDTTTGMVTFTGDANATGYTAELTQGAGSREIDVVKTATGYEIDLNNYLSAGSEYSLTITGEDSTGVYQTGTRTIALYKLSDPDIVTLNTDADFLKSGKFEFTHDSRAITNTVTVDENKGSYADGVVTFDKTLPLHEAEIVVASTGGQVDETTYILDAANTATLTTITGQIPAYKVSSIKAMPNNTEQVTFQFADSSVSALWTKLYAQCQSLIQLSGSGTYGSFVYATNNGNTVTCHRATGSDRDMSVNTATGVLTANFGLQVTNHLVSGQTYDMRVVAYAKNEVRAILGNSETVIEDVGFNRNQLNPSISINTQTGMLVISGMDDDYVKQVEMQVDGSANVTVVKNGDNIFNVAGITDNNVHTLTFTAIANSTEMADSAPVTIEVKQLPVATAEANTEGKLDVTGYNAGEGKLSVTVDYTDTTLADLEQTVDAAADLTGYVDDDVLASAYGPVTVKTQAKGERVTVNAVDRFYVSAAAQTETSDFSVGQLPAVTMGDQLTKENGKWVIKYTLSADADLYGDLQLKLTTGLEGEDVTIEADSFTGNGTFDVDSFVTSIPGTYDYELTTNGVQYPSINSFETQAEEDAYTYNVGQLQAPDVKVNTTTGALTWTAVSNASSYSVEIDNVETNLGTDLSYLPTLTAGQEQVITIIANPESGDYTASSTTVTLYKLENPVINTVNTDSAFLKSGTFAYTADDSTTYDYDTIVTVDGGDGKYENGVVTFDLTKALHEATIEVALKGKAGANNVYTIDADSTDTMTTVTGQIPAYKMDSKTVLANGNVEVKFSFKNEADAELWAKLYQQSKSLLQLSGTGTYGTFVYAEKDQTSIACHSVTTSDKDIVLSSATGNITATFGLSGNALQSGVDYDFRVVAYGKSEVAAVLENSTTVIDADAFEITKLTVSPKVDAAGKVTFGMTAEDLAATDYVNVTYKGTTKQIAENDNLYTLFSIDSSNVSLNTFTFQAVAKDATRQNSDPVEITVVPMAAPEISFTDKGYFTVSADANGTLEVKLNDSVVTAGVDGQYSYADVVSNATEPVQLTVAATLTGKIDGSTTYLSSSATAQSDFYVGPLPTLVHDSTTTEVATSETKLVLQVADQTQLWDMIDWSKSDATIADPADPEHPFEDCTIAHNDADHTVTITWNAAMSEGEKVVKVSLASLNDSVAKATVSTVEFTFVLDQYPAPVIVPGTLGKLSIKVPDGAVLAADLGDGKWGAVTDTEDLLAWLDTVIEDNDTSLHEVQFKFVDETVTLSMDDVPADSDIVTLKVQRLAAPTVDATATDGTFTVTNPNAIGKLAVKVDGTDVTSENGIYAVPDTILSGPFPVTAQAQVETNPVDGVYYLDSAVTEVNGTKAGTPLDAPVGKITVSKRTIYWNDVANAASYEVWIDGVKDEDAAFDTTVNGENTHTYTMDLSVGVHEVQIVAVPEANKGLQSTASEVYHVTQLPDMVSAAVNKATGVVTFEVDEYDAATTGLPETNPYGHCRVNVAFSPKTSGSWNSTEKTATYTTNQDATLTYLRVSVGGASFKDEDGVQQYHLMPKIYAQNTEKFYIGELPAFTLESVVENDNDTTTVTFVTESEEELASILDLDATIATFAYSYESLDEPATEGSWGHTADQISAQVDGNKLIFTLQTPTTAGYELTYSFTAQPAAAVAAVRSEMESTGTIEYKGNKLSAPTGLKMEIVNGEPVLVWNAVDGAQGYKVLKNGAESQSASECSFKPTISNAGVSVTYSVYAVGETGVTDDSEAAEIVIQKVDNSIVTDFTLRSPAVSLRSQRVNYTMTTTNANLKRVLAFTTDNEAVTITHTTDTATTYDVAYSGDTFAEVKLNAYICGEYKDVWYYSPTVKAEGSFIVGPVASNATVSSVTMSKAGSVVVTLSFAGINSSAIDFTNYSCTMTGSDGEPIAAASRSLNTTDKTLKLTFKTGVVEGDYKLDLTLPVKAAYAENEMLQAYTVSIDTVTVPAYAG